MIKVERVNTYRREILQKRTKKDEVYKIGIGAWNVSSMHGCNSRTLGHMYYEKNDLPYKVKIVRRKWF